MASNMKYIQSTYSTLKIVLIEGKKQQEWTIELINLNLIKALTAGKCPQTPMVHYTFCLFDLTVGYSSYYSIVVLD